MRASGRRSWGTTLAIAAALVVVVMGTTAAWATTGTGHQNPHLLVVAKVTPTQAHAGDTIVARATVTNTTKRTLTIRWGLTFTTPTSGIAEETTGELLKPGASVQRVFRRAVTVSSYKGTFALSVHASDAAGRSHAAAHATAS
jgi:hypothetical protein